MNHLTHQTKYALNNLQHSFFLSVLQNSHDHSDAPPNIGGWVLLRRVTEGMLKLKEIMVLTSCS